MMQLQFKNINVFYSFTGHALHPQLAAVLYWTWQKFADVIVTSAWRPHPIHLHDSGIHTTDPLRAVDLRSWIYPDPQMVVDLLNNSFKYDPLRTRLNVAICHNTGHGVHFHIQVHDRTVKI